MTEFKLEHKKQQSSEHGTVSQRKGAAVLPDHRSQVIQARALTDNRAVQLAAQPLGPTMQMKENVNINNDHALEHEADVMGSKALSASSTQMKQSMVSPSAPISPALNAGPESTLQLQKANGWYRLSKAGNFRNENAGHTVQRNLPINTIVKVIDKGPRVSNFKAGWVTNEHSWSKIPLQNATGWLEDGKLSNAARAGQLPHDEFLRSIGAARTDYHFGLNEAGAVDDIGHRMDYIKEIDAGTVAEYDWRDVGDLPAHIQPADHTRLAGALHQGENIVPDEHTVDPIRAAAATFKNPAILAPVAPILPTNYEKYTFHRKAHNSGQNHLQIKTMVDYAAHVHPGVDFSKSALIDQLVQNKQIHFHLSGMQSRWRGAAAADMTGADFVEVVTKTGAYLAGGNMKDHVTFRELRFVWRYWTRNLLIPNDAGVPTNYTFNGHVTFYFNGSKVRPPWLWGAADHGASPASRA